MLPDGNCMFWAVAYQLLKDAEQHKQLRHATVAFATQNGETLKVYLPERDMEDWNTSLQQHLKQMQNLGCWGTHLELKAMASMLQLPIYVLTDSLVPGECRWTRFSPQSSPLYPSHELRNTYLARVLNWPQGSPDSDDQLQWIEICHSNASHYDSVNNISSAPHSPPPLSENTSAVVVLE